MTTPTSLELIIMTKGIYAAQIAMQKRKEKAQRAAAKGYECLECGKKLTPTQASRAIDHGCPNCGGVDIDVAKR